MKNSSIIFEEFEFEEINSHIEITEFRGEKVLKVIKDTEKIPFEINNMESSVDEPTYAKIKNLNFENGVIEVKLFSQIQEPRIFEHSRGFIGLAYRINPDDSEFECIYLRPYNGTSKNQIMRNHTIQYFSYPHYKFETLRKTQEGKYESWAPVALNEWINLKVKIDNEIAEVFVDDIKYSVLFIDKMLGKNKKGELALFVDVDTVGYFKDIKITKK